MQKRGWGDFLGSLLGGLSKSPTAEELNGSRTKDFKAKNCGPYGQGGTPNSCNFRR
ncbi:ComC/BlpC family peptide pheromone/bacteriocin (plasmid) [Enterococcus faecium]|nr:ComC/BlpC family peptide pheromone/bacteriocin [Enterococcus faecium]QNG06999.1 ComC/BlpC family peptide pheromone/bacteriocin [Enterococcus hirae]EGP5617065.1 ComC/BlpC family peptide pheromone/bacteriocin [Enterococcus faecium]MCZ1525668.1 ComC/BlpC family peptide pheromone/bacteriocin [Enterococcus faecium]QDZ65035.1 ComC/BlpC family peptide pheromone/bacteriocin [Enterococcus faecium]